jgi:hypothetical protein
MTSGTRRPSSRRSRHKHAFEKLCTSNHCDSSVRVAEAWCGHHRGAQAVIGALRRSGKNERALSWNLKLKVHFDPLATQICTV